MLADLLDRNPARRPVQVCPVVIVSVRYFVVINADFRNSRIDGDSIVGGAWSFLARHAIVTGDVAQDKTTRIVLLYRQRFLTAGRAVAILSPVALPGPILHYRKDCQILQRKMIWLT